jgi:hypothetical protein
MDGAAEFPDDAKIVDNEAPLHERLKHKSTFHNELLGRLMDIRDEAAKPVENMHDDWNRVDEHMGLHVDLSRSSIKGDGTSDPDRKEIPFEKALVVPVTFAVEKTIQAQLTSIFNARDPMFQYDGHEPGDVQGAKLIEAVVANHLRRGSADMTAYQSIQNALRYGNAPVHTHWYEEYGYMMKPIVQGPMAELIGQKFPELVRPIRQWGRRQQYVRHQAIDPYKLRIDPRKSLSTYQDGDHIGHAFVESLLYFKSRKLENEEGAYFNVDALDDTGWVGSEKDTTNKTHLDEPGKQGDDIEDVRAYETEHLEVRLIPNEWELSDSDKPEIWWFEWCGDAVIVRAHPSPYDHGKFNYSIGCAYPDQNVILGMGLGQLIDPFQRFMTWMASSRFENVRRFLNNSSLIAENFVEVADVLNPKPAGHVRLTQAAQDLIAQGVISDPRVFLPQLALTDVTGQHMADIQTLFEWVGRLSGSNDMTQGIHLPSKRTATEIEKLTGAASQRTMSMGEALDTGLFESMADQHAQIIQQFMTDEQWFRVGGDLARDIQQRVGESDAVKPSGGGLHVRIAPQDIYGMYDYVPYTGMDPEAPGKSVEALMNLMQVTMQTGLHNPQMGMQMGEEEVADLKEFVVRIGQNLKVKDVERFFKPNPILVMQQQQFEAAKQAGNVVPADQVA